ncbi:mycothiol synthase [Cnuibacter sp. UC19_7]|uniref:mycothiol synthase n=1 Tax=Cnuibacter sp. UC19_7 TaxID=3350166 RepID=UPI00366AF327
MTGRLSLSLSDPAQGGEALEHLVSRAVLVDGQPPFNDQALVEVMTGERSLLLAESDGTTIGAAVLSGDELELVVDPEWRQEGFGARLVELVLQSRPASTLLAWAHGDHPAARHLAARYRFEPIRTLYQLRRELSEPGVDVPAPDGYRLASFDAAGDLDDWVGLNAVVFRSHPEQGRITADDVRARMREDWFDAGDFLLLRQGGELAGYIWLKIEPGDEVGEVYVVGVSPDHAGRGLGRFLTRAGLARLAERGVRHAALYVDGDNTAAMSLYRSLGFTDHTVDVQYRRDAPRAS